MDGSFLEWILENPIFQWSIQKKGTGIGHLGARDNPTIKLNKNFNFHWCMAPFLSEAVEASLCYFFENW